MKFSHSYLTTHFVLYFKPQHTMMHSICDFSVQISNVSCSITSKNCFRIKSVLTLSSSHVVANLPTPNYHPSTFDTICNMLTGYTIFPSFLQPTSSNDIGLHTIGILITLNSWFLIQERCNLILVCCIKIPSNYT